MARTTDIAVGGIIEWDSDVTKSTHVPLAPFIEIANALVTECCSTDDYDAARLELIERWLAAHFYTVRDMRAESEGAKGVTEKKQSKVDLGFDTSHYGQTAMRLDTAGGLAALNENTKKGRRPLIGISWLGTEDAEIED